jgi:hypothetical protein
MCTVKPKDGHSFVNFVYHIAIYILVSNFVNDSSRYAADANFGS